MTDPAEVSVQPATGIVCSQEQLNNGRFNATVSLFFFNKELPEAPTALAAST